MANTTYTKATDFASKDSLLTGNPLKIVKGTEIDDEFNEIQSVVNVKADLNSPDFTGTPTAPTASAGTNTTQVATTAYVQGEVNDGTVTIATGSGLTGSGEFSMNQSNSETITISHSDTSSQGSVNNSGSTFIQDITLDGFGHITGIASATYTYPTTAGAVNTYAWVVDYGSPRTFGSTVSGSTIYIAGHYNTSNQEQATASSVGIIGTTGGTLSGTWRIMNNIDSGIIGTDTRTFTYLVVRIS